MHPLVVNFTVEKASKTLVFSTQFFNTKSSISLSFGKKDEKRIQKSRNFRDSNFYKNKYFFFTN